jgi:quercetin dioxygenase-like cupin family protein
LPKKDASIGGGKMTADRKALLDVAFERADDILMLYRNFVDKKPVILSRTLRNDNRLKAMMLGFGQGEELSDHTASMPAVLHFLQGEAKLTLGDNTMKRNPAPGSTCPTGLRHSIQAKTPVVMVLLLMK